MSLKNTLELGRIIRLYCYDYKQLLPDNPTKDEEIEALFSSYKSLNALYEDEIYSLLEKIIEEISLLALQNKENVRKMLVKNFSFINKHNSARIRIADIKDEEIALTIQLTYETISDVTKSIKKLVYDLSGKKKDNSKNLIDKSLFRNAQETQKYIDILKHTSPPILDFKGTFILGKKSKSKGSVVVWYDLLIANGIINTNLSVQQRVDAINSLIPNFEISKRSFGNLTRAHHHYESQIKKLIAEI